MLVKTFNLSGFDGNYEEVCQKMLWSGILYLDKMSKELPEGGKGILDGRTVLNNAYGLSVTPFAFEECKKEMLKSVNDDCTGAMLQCVTGHLQFIEKNGIKVWEEKLKQSEQELVFDTEKMLLIDNKIL